MSSNFNDGETPPFFQAIPGTWVMPSHGFTGGGKNPPIDGDLQLQDGVDLNLQNGDFLNLNRG